jgi:hypothetical protein
LALHAQRLGFIHPVTGKKVEVEAPLFHDFNYIINVLEKHNG